MYPRLIAEPVSLRSNGKTHLIPRNKLAAAFAGSVASKELIMKELSGFKTVFSTSFEQEYQEAMPDCIKAANSVGRFATAETLEFFNPAVPLGRVLADRLKHKDNPYYPFFEE